MSLKKVLTSAALITSLVAAQVGPLASVSYARDGGRAYGDSFEHGGNGRGSNWNGGYRHQDQNAYRYQDQHSYSRGNRDYYAPAKRRDHTGRNVAIGIGAALLVAIIASEAGRRDRR